MTLKKVKVPDSLVDRFSRAEEFVESYFERKVEDPEEGTISVGQERYILVRARALSVGFLELLDELLPDMQDDARREHALSILYKVSHSIGKADAKAFHIATGVNDPIDKLSTGPVHFAYAGWASVDIKEESTPAQDDSFYLLYDHPHSFEADGWIHQGWKTDFCACVMNAGYSSGWCSESFGMKLASKELMCRAQGDDCCRFIMAPPDKLDDLVEKYISENEDIVYR